jgi:hypothetical protein
MLHLRKENYNFFKMGFKRAYMYKTLKVAHAHTSSRFLYVYKYIYNFLKHSCIRLLLNLLELKRIYRKNALH